MARSLIVTIILLFSGNAGILGAASPGWIKVLISKGGSSAIDAGAMQQLRSSGSRQVESYDVFQLIQVPAQAVSALRGTATKLGLTFEERDDLDKIYLPNLTYDARGNLRRTDYAEDTKGLYVIQFIGPAKPIWLDLGRFGIEVLQAVHQNALIVAATPAQVRAFLRPGRARATQDDSLVDVLIADRTNRFASSKQRAPMRIARMRQLLVAAAFLAIDVNAATSVRLVPAFATQVAGASGSLWQSEIRLYNSSQEHQVVQTSRVYSSGEPCSGFDPITLAPGALAQIRSIGCRNGSAAAVEISADQSVFTASVITNLGATAQQDPCCLAGFTQQIPAIPIAQAYSAVRTVENLQIPVVNAKNIGHHNLIFVNPNLTALQITLRYFDSSAVEELGAPFPYSTVSVPASSYLQVNDVLPQLSLPFETPVFSGFWRIQASAAEPFYFLDSYVDNATYDATTIESH